VHERLRRLGPDDLARQTWLIQASFAMLPGQPVAAIERLQVFDSNAAAEIQRFIPENLSPQLASPLPDEASQQTWPQAAARAIAERLRQLAWQNEREAEWLVLQPRQRGWVIAPIGLGGRDGLAAIVRFLAALARLTKDASYRRLAVKAANSLLRRMEDPTEQPSLSEVERQQAMDVLREIALGRA
jgi:class II lanthipeptide synthase